jgi:virulence-associated protein VagC
MAQEAAVEQKARIVRSGHSQSVRLPAAFQPEKSSWEEVFRLFDEARAAGETLEIERDQSPLRDISL